MDDDVCKLLKSWKLEEYITKFAENKITLDTFILLDKVLIKILIPPVGDRAKFTKNLAEWNLVTQSLQGDPDFSPQVDFLHEHHRNVTLQDITNSPSTSNSPDVQSHIVATPISTNTIFSVSDGGDENIKIL